MSAFFFIIVPVVMAQEHSDQVEIGAFADYFRFGQTNPVSNFAGIGARVSFNVHRDIQLEAEMAYDFQRNFTNRFSNGVTTQLVNSNLRTLHGLFGPKFQTGSGAFRVVPGCGYRGLRRPDWAPARSGG